MSTYPILAEKNLESAGGAEVQLVSIAKELVRYGYDVSFVTFDYGQKNASILKNTEVIKSYRYDKARELNFFAKFAYIFRALWKSHADIYVCSADSHGVLPFFSFLKRKKFIYRIPSDKVVLNGSESLVIRLVELVDIKKANIVIAQSLYQKEKLRANFGVKSVVIKNSFDVPKFKPK